MCISPVPVHPLRYILTKLKSTYLYHPWISFMIVFICYNRTPTTGPYAQDPQTFRNKSVTSSTSSNLFGVIFN